MAAKKSIIPIFIPHLGCPHECVFCNQRRIAGSLLPATPKDVAQAAGNAHVRSAQLAFYGGSFTALPLEEQKAFLLAAQPFLDNGTIDSIRLSTRPDCIDMEILRLLKKYGVSTIELGVQSMDDEVLMHCARGHTASDTEKASKLIKDFGFELVLQMMTGLFLSTAEKDIKTARSIAMLSPDAVRIYPTVIIRDTRLHDLYLSGEYREHTVAEAVEVCAKIVPIFEEAGIRIIRLGLNPTEDLSGGGAVGGAYHPAFGELVKSRLLLEKARRELSGTPRGSDVTLMVSPPCISQMIGQKRSNVKTLKEEFSLKSLKIIPGEIKNGEIIVQTVAKEREM